MPEVLTEPKPVSCADFYRLIRERLDYQENLMNQRVNWLVFSQSFLFIAYTTLLNSPPEPKSPIYGELQSFLVLLIPALSLISSILIYMSVFGSLFYMSNLRRTFESYPEDETIKYFPPIQSTTLIRRIGELPPLLLPLLLIGTWVFLLIKELA
jgi:hypothetical protein